MAMSRGAKIALGCGIAFLLVVMATAAAIFGAAWWGYGKAKQVAKQIEGDQQRIEAARKRANTNAFTPPQDGVIREDRLVKFLGVRRRVFGVYAKYKDLIESQGKKDKPDLSGVTQLLPIFNEVRTVQAEALADQGMSEAEYQFLVGAIYKTMLARGVAEAGGGKKPSEVVQNAADQMAEQAEKAAAEAEANADLPAEVKQQLRETARKLREQATGAGEQVKDIDVPPANIELFRKYQDQIKEYAMGGLELIGL